MRGKGRLDPWSLFATALVIGGVAGPLPSGLRVQHLGFPTTFYAFAGLAALGAIVFTVLVPDASPEKQREEETPVEPEPAFSGA